MKPKIYVLWHFDYDGNSSWQFTHPHNKLKMEFEQDCEDVLREYAEIYINNFRSWIGTDGLIELIAEKLPTRGYVPFDEIFENISFGLGGSRIIRPKSHEDDDGEDDVRKLLGEELLSKVYSKNDEIEKSI